VLFGKRRAYQRKVAVAEFEGVVSGDIYVLAPKDTQRLLPELLPFLCLSERFFQHAVGTSAGSLSPRTNWSSLASFEFDLPPLDQQRRIAEILWAVDEVAESWRASESALEKAHTAKLNAMMLGTTDGTEQQLRDIGDFTPPSGWKVQRAQELVSSPITKGATPSPHLNTKNATVPFLKVYNLTFTGALDFTIDPTYVEPKIHETDLKRSRVRPGDVLMNLVGPPLGKTALVPDGFPEANVNQAIAIYRISDVTIRGFFAEYLRTDLAQKWLEKRSKKTSGQRNLTLELAQDLPVPIPPPQLLSGVVKTAAEWSVAKQRIKTVLKDTIAVGQCITNLL
jgi:type I restriction enzyme S subunit